MSQSARSKRLAVALIYFVAICILALPIAMLQTDEDTKLNLFFYLVYGTIGLPIVVTLLLIAASINRRRHLLDQTITPKLVSGLIWSGVSVVSAILGFIGVTLGTGLMLIVNDIGQQNVIGVLLFYTGLLAYALSIVPIVTFILSIYRIIRKR